MYLWRAADDEGEVLDVLNQARRDTNAALRLMRKLLKRQRPLPTSIVTDRYRAYDAVPRDLDCLTSTGAASGRTTKRKLRTCRSGDESGRCKACDLPDRRNDFSPATQPSTTRSMSTAT
jgi:transposase-like protein